MITRKSIIYYEPVNGQYRVAKYTYYKDGLLNGQFKEYYPNTRVKREGVYKDGHLNGIVKYYHGNGRIQIPEELLNHVGIEERAKIKLSPDGITITTDD